MTPVAMVVEDDDGLRLIYNHVLSAMGFKVVEAADGETAMDILQEMTPNILFLDMRLPFISGSDILNYIGETKRFANTRVVVASSNHPDNEQITGRVVEFILKPIRPAQIREIAGGVL